MSFDTTFLRSLQAFILADKDCADYVITNETELPPKEERPPRYSYTMDNKVAEIVNGKGFASGSKSVPCHLAKKLLIKRGRWRGIVSASNDPSHPAVDAAFAAVALAEDPRMDADFCDPGAAPLLDQLVEHGLLSDPDKESLKALCRTPSAITADEVSRALRGPWGDEKE